MVVFILFSCVVSFWFYLYAAYIGLMCFKQSEPTNSDYHPPISILKPLCGPDADAYAKLSSFCQQAYPIYQIIFGVRDPADPAIAVVEKLIADFPQVDIRLVADDRILGNNLKVSNIANIEPYAHHEFLLIADSDIKVGPSYLQRLVQPMQDRNVGLVTCLYRSQATNPIAAFEALSISTDFHPSVLVARQLGWMKFAMGSSILIRRSVLNAIGGFKAIADHLADDFMLGNLTTQAGYRVALSDYVVDHTLETPTFIDLIEHQTRWNRCTRSSNFTGYLGLFFSHGVMLSLVLVALTRGVAWSWAVFGLILAARLFAAWAVGVRCLEDPVVAKFLWLVPLRDLLSFGLWVYGLAGDRVVWRDQQFCLLKGGKLERLEPLSETALVAKEVEPTECLKV
ncbi:bacteriohopanetetrol glucosamine biosynthesis glycosyltransferase HpnI [Altericista sp. CCNU0014]|uniref:bacteriohopanetetrol glucosamine biosynthesis glycosyltransferase HpnI n=1 Tax=Altericista sp. CCNU0014 TaxID=3082949 RepID=UPI00384F12E4